jgi:hypothetical protein
MSASSAASDATHRASIAATAAFAHVVLSMHESLPTQTRTGANVGAGRFGYTNGAFPYNEGASWLL